MRQLSGFFQAIVTDNADPDDGGRVKVRLPATISRGRKGQELWARIATLMAGDNRGTWFIPDIGDEVLLGFDGGEAGQAYVVGALWGGGHSPPETMAAGNNKKLVRSRNGVKITLDDQSDRESIIIETPAGQKITLKDGPGAVELNDSNGNSIELRPDGVVITASAKVTVNASQVEISAGMVKIDAGIAKFSGVVQCDTLISNSVVSASYTPGAGNIA